MATNRRRLTAEQLLKHSWLADATLRPSFHRQPGEYDSPACQLTASHLEPVRRHVSVAVSVARVDSGGANATFIPSLSLPSSAYVDEHSGSLKQQIMQYKADAEAVGVVFLNHVLESYSVFQVNLT